MKMLKQLARGALGLCLALLLAVPASANNTSRPGRVNKLDAGSRYSGYVDEGGSLWMWGVNDFGTLGIGKDAESWQAVPVKVMDGVAGFSSCISDDDYGWHSAAVKTDGSLWMWGSNSLGQLGNGGVGNTKSHIPVQTVPVKVMDDVAAASCGRDVTAIIKTDGSLWMCGAMIYGARAGVLLHPVKVMDDVAAVSCGMGLYGYAAAIKTDGSLWTWGLSALAGNGMQGENCESLDGPGPAQLVPMKIMDDVAAVSCGQVHSAAVKTDGSLWVWGLSDAIGLEGCGDVTLDGESFQSVPKKVLDGAAAVSCGLAVTAAIKTDGSLWMWGWNDAGQMGSGTIGDNWDFFGSESTVQRTPVKVLDHAEAVSLGYAHVLAAKTDGSLWTWGYNCGGTDRPFGKEMSEADQFILTPTRVNVGKPSGGAQSSGGQPSGASGGPRFSDVPSGAYYAEPVAWAVEKGITAGTSETAFSPNKDCTTAQILTFLWRANGSPKAAGSNPFSDVKPGDYFYDAALWAAEKGMVSGGAFHGGTPCTRSMAVTYMWKAAGSPSAGAASFTDVPSGTDCAGAVAWAVEKGVTAGTTASTFSPDSACTRGQIVTFLYRGLAK